MPRVRFPAMELFTLFYREEGEEGEVRLFKRREEEKKRRKEEKGREEKRKIVCLSTIIFLSECLNYYKINKIN